MVSNCYGTCWTLPLLSGTKPTISASRYNDEDGFEGNVWDADTGTLEGKCKRVLGASTAQQVIPKKAKRGGLSSA